MSFVEVCIMQRVKQQPLLTTILIAVKKLFDEFYSFLKISGYFHPVGKEIYKLSNTGSINDKRAVL